MINAMLSNIRKVVNNLEAGTKTPEGKTFVTTSVDVLCLYMDDRFDTCTLK